MDVEKVLEKCRKDLEKVGRFPSDLKGICAIASYKLFKELRKNGFESEIVLMRFENGTAHCWIESDGEAFDLTATQPGLGRIVKEERRKYLKLLFSNTVMKLIEKSTERFNDEELFKRYLKKTRWHNSQIPR